MRTIAMFFLMVALLLAGCAPASGATEAAVSYPTAAINIMAPAAPGGG